MLGTASPEVRQTRLRVPELLDRIAQHVDRIKTLGFYRPTLRFVQFNKRDKHLDLVTILCAFRRPPTGLS